MKRLAIGVLSLCFSGIVFAQGTLYNSSPAMNGASCVASPFSNQQQQLQSVPFGSTSAIVRSSDAFSVYSSQTSIGNDDLPSAQKNNAHKSVTPVTPEPFPDPVGEVPFALLALLTAIYAVASRASKKSHEQ